MSSPDAFQIFQRRADLLKAEPPPTPMRFVANRLEFKQALVGEGLQDAMLYAEISRIMALPLVHPMTTEESEEFNRMHLLAPAFDSGFRLFDRQAEGAAAYSMAHGLFGSIGVGWGKTLLALLIASLATSSNIQRIVYHMPPNVLAQLANTDIKWARTKININYSIHVLGGKGMDARRSLAKSGKKGLYLFPYSMLSTRDAQDNLFDIAPGLIIADEAHNIANRTAARTKRVLAYIEENKPQLVVLSGTITKKTIRDYWHLIKAALHDNNPLPNSSAMASDWGAVIDAEAGGGSTGPLLPLVHWARTNFPADRGRLTEDVQGFRTAYRLRMNSSPGVVASGDAELGTSLVIANAPIKEYKSAEGWDKLDQLIQQVNDAWLTPNGDEIEHAIHTFKWLYELCHGFYNELIWPTKEVYAARKGIPPEEAFKILAKSVLHHMAGQAYAKELRRWLQEKAKPGIDTPLLVGQSMFQHGAKHVTQDLFALWQQWRALDFENRPDRDSRAVRVCGFKVDGAVEWAKSLPADRGAIIWYYHQEIGKWVAEKLAAAGVDYLHCPAGDVHNRSILDPANTNKKVVASITAHGTGKNLQHFEEQYFVQWPRQADVAEQALGRTHRNGQKADELIVWRNATLNFDDLCFAACLNDSLYIHQTTGNRQKLIYAAYDPPPTIFPGEVLRERGFQNQILNTEQRALLAQKFAP